MISFGIDFGTTNSAAVKLSEHAEAQHYGDDFGSPYPSIVAIDRATGEAVGGRRVWEERERFLDGDNHHVVQSVKAWLGTDRVWQTQTRKWTAQDVASFILGQLSERASNLGMERIRRAAITIPVGLSPEARSDLRMAANRAGIELSTFVTESTAAFMRYLPDLRHCHYVAVFDWGGGTLDISVLELKNATIRELATEGMSIAGDEIDLDLARSVHARVMEERRLTTPFESMSSADRDNLRTKCEYAKRQLSQLSVADVILPSYGGAPYHFEMNRAWFQAIVTPHVDLAIERLSDAIASCRLSADAIDRILIVGGSSKLKLLQDKLRADHRFSAALQISEDAEWDVAHGAAFVNQSTGGYQTAESIGVVLSDNSYYELIAPGEPAVESPRSLVLSLVEDARQANIIVERRQNQHSAAAERVLSFGVDTLGFNLEELRLDYSISPDLLLKIQVASASLSPSTAVTREYGKLRFAYRF